MPKPEQERLAEQLRQSGVDVERALPAWTGIYPAMGPYGNWELLLNRWRVLAWRGDTVELWTRWSGLPSKRLLTVQAADVCIVRERRRYDLVAVGTKHVWVPSRYREVFNRPVS